MANAKNSSQMVPFQTHFSGRSRTALKLTMTYSQEAELKKVSIEQIFRK